MQLLKQQSRLGREHRSYRLCHKGASLGDLKLRSQSSHQLDNKYHQFHRCQYEKISCLEPEQHCPLQAMKPELLQTACLNISWVPPLSLRKLVKQLQPIAFTAFFQPNASPNK